MLNLVNEQLIFFSIHLNINQNDLVVKAENDTFMHLLIYSPFAGHLLYARFYDMKSI